VAHGALLAIKESVWVPPPKQKQPTACQRQQTVTEQNMEGKPKEPGTGEACWWDQLRVGGEQTVLLGW